MQAIKIQNTGDLEAAGEGTRTDNMKLILIFQSKYMSVIWVKDCWSRVEMPRVIRRKFTEMSKELDVEEKNERKNKTIKVEEEHEQKLWMNQRTWFKFVMTSFH